MGANFFETGIYTITDVSRLTGIHPKTVKGWISGYSYAVKDGIHLQDALWVPEIPREDSVIRLGFNDLLEIRAVNEIRKLGIPLQKIRAAIRNLQSLIRVSYPFSRRVIYSDGRSLFVDLTDDDGKPIFLDLSSAKQTAFYDVILPQLIGSYQFEDDIVRRWHPSNEFSRIVIDPRIVFGRPVVEGTRIEAKLLAAAYKAEKSFGRVARLYGLKEFDVRQAVGFHNTLKAA
jgi:uncharacterized protein (DUF433 family)